LLHLVGSSILLYLIDDARTNKNQVFKCHISEDFCFFVNELDCHIVRTSRNEVTKQLVQLETSSIVRELMKLGVESTDRHLKIQEVCNQGPAETTSCRRTHRLLQNIYTNHRFIASLKFNFRYLSTSRRTVGSCYIWRNTVRPFCWFTGP